MTTQVRYVAVPAGENSEQMIVNALFSGQQTPVWQTRSKLEAVLAKDGLTDSYEILTFTVEKTQ